MRYLLPRQIPVFLDACDPLEYADLAAVLVHSRACVSPRPSPSNPETSNPGGDDQGLPPDHRRKPLDAQGQGARPVEIGRRLAEQLNAGSRGATNGYPMLFPDPDDGDYLDRTEIRRRWHIPALLDAGLDPRLRVHDSATPPRRRG